MIQNGYSSRNSAIDILRALTMVLMVFVNDLWSISGFPEWFSHSRADQDFLGLSDIVFPCFLFVVGMSIPYAIENSFRKGRTGVEIAGHILTRSLALLVMGIFLVNTESGIASASPLGGSIYKILMIAAFILIWNQYPKSGNKSIKLLHSILKGAGIVLLIYLGIIFRDPEGNVLGPQWWGILGIIGWTYLVCAFIYFFTRDRLKYLIPIWIIFIVWNWLRCDLISTGAPILNLPEGNALDALLNTFNIGNGAHCALTMGGMILSVLDVRYRQGKLSAGDANTTASASCRKPLIAAAGIVLALLLLGYFSNRFWIISKIRATSPWVFYCSAIAVGTYAILSLLTAAGKEKWFAPIRPAGTATLTCYLIPYVLYSLFAICGMWARPAFCATGFIGVMGCILFSFLCVFITYLLTRIHIKLKI